MKYLQIKSLLVFSMTFAAMGCVPEDDAIDGDTYDASFAISDGAGDTNALVENSAEARAILEVVNTYSLHGLIRDVDLYYNGSRHIIDHRNGADGIRNTTDDMLVRSMAELDRVPHIGPKSLLRLRKYVAAAGLVAAHEVPYADIVPALIDTSHGAAFRGEIGPSDLIRIPVEAQQGDRLLIWFRKADRVQWNPRVKVVDATTGDTLASANPWGNTDARLPAAAEDASHGFEIDSSQIAVVLDNTSTRPGRFEFWLECVGGPCAPKTAAPQLDGDFGTLHDDELRAQMVARHERTHTYLDYYDARLVMFQDLDNDNGVVECVYTGVQFQTNTIPSNLEMNAEHTWPQSHGAVNGAARSDLHHLYPVDSAINSLRANHPYCNVEDLMRQDGGSRYGETNGVRCFEPRDEHKGNVARAMFYFASVYQQEIDRAQERTLRAWHELDPVDDAERDRNERVQVIQGSRNPFIDEPTLVGRVSDF